MLKTITMVLAAGLVSGGAMASETSPPCGGVDPDQFNAMSAHYQADEMDKKVLLGYIQKLQTQNGELIAKVQEDKTSIEKLKKGNAALQKPTQSAK